MQILTSRRLNILAAWIFVLSAMPAITADAQETSEGLPVRIAEGIERTGARLTVPVPADAKSGKFYLPRYFASLRMTAWGNGVEASQASDDKSISITPEPDYWVVKWNSRPEGGSHLHITFDSAPLLADQVVPIKAAGDGSFDLPAAMAFTAGEKVRFEPQTFKNTVGYWVGAEDNARWRIVVGRPGEFNVGVLQGCGSGQGGSQATVRVFEDSGSQKEPTDSQLHAQTKFEVLETGHFQNFQWRHVGTIAITKPGVYWVEVRPIAIKKNALMDIRRLHLVRLPSK
ncbi:MAG: hypothetical protein Aurels2KO_46380 [Aureliella sp.]